MTEVETIRVRARRSIRDGDMLKILELRDALYEIVLECDMALEASMVKSG